MGTGRSNICGSSRPRLRNMEMAPGKEGKEGTRPRRQAKQHLESNAPRVAPGRAEVLHADRYGPSERNRRNGAISKLRVNERRYCAVWLFLFADISLGDGPYKARVGGVLLQEPAGRNARLSVVSKTPPSRRSE